MTARQAMIAAGGAMRLAASAGELVSLTWSWPGVSVSINWDRGEWFWVAYDRKLGRTVGCGRAATIEAAVDQAKAATQALPLAAE